VTNSVGAKTVTCTATDKAGNTITANTSYNVVYNFAGFFAPISNLPKFNRVPAGWIVPIRFSLGGFQGLNIIAPGFPKSEPIACPVNSSEVEDTERASTNPTLLIYIPLTKRYTYLWRTETSWKNTCRQFTIQFNDGTVQRANFKFTK
jgi:hypothetical protein